MLPYMGPDIHSSFLYRNTQLNTTPTLDSIDHLTKSKYAPEVGIDEKEFYISETKHSLMKL